MKWDAPKKIIGFSLEKMFRRFDESIKWKKMCRHKKFRGSGSGLIEGGTLIGDWVENELVEEEVVEIGNGKCWVGGNEKLVGWALG